MQVAIVGGQAGIGDTVWYRDYKGDTVSALIDDIIVEVETSTKTGERSVTYRLYTDAKDYRGPHTVCSRESLVNAVKINGDHLAEVGGEVWIWLAPKAANPALVRKVVVWGWQDLMRQGQRGWLQTAYADNLDFSYGIAANRCYASEQEALNDRPDLAAKREVALMRAGRQQGERVAA